MVDAPERIWACPRGGRKCVVSFTSPSLEYNVEYVRADLYEQVKRERDDAIEWRDKYKGDCEVLAKWNAEEAAERLAGARVNTGCKDRNGEQIYLGDKVRYRLEGTHTKPEYWNPEYEVIFVPPAFTLKHIGGGKDGGSHDFKLRHGGGNGDLEIIERGPYHAALAEPAGEAEPDALRKWREDQLERVRDGSFLLRTTPPDASAIREALDRRFTLAWIAGARPPVHPEPMKGRQSFATFDEAISFFQRRAPDSQFVSLTEYATETIDRTDDARAALAGSAE